MAEIFFKPWQTALPARIRTLLVIGSRGRQPMANRAAVAPVPRMAGYSSDILP